MEYKRIFKDGSNLLIGRLGTVFIGFINLMILTRILTTEEMGKYSLFLMVVNLALILGLNWSDASIVRHGREEFVKHGKINQSFWARFYLFFPMLILFIFLFIIFGKQISEYIGVEYWLIVFVIGMFVLNGLINSITCMYRSIDRMKISAYVLFSQKLFYLVGLALLFFNVFATKLSLILIIINLSFLISLIYNLIRFDFNIIKPYKFSKEYFKKIWTFSWPQFIGFSGLYIINYVDLYVIRKYMTLADVGVYSVAYNGFTMICGVVLLINTVFMPLIVEYRAKQRFDLIRKYLKKIPLFSSGWVIVVLAGIVLSRYLIPLLFSEKYVASIPSFNILLIASVFFFASTCLTPIINAYDLILYLQGINIIASVLNIIFDFILIPHMGIVGAAYATSIAFILAFFMKTILIFIRRKHIFILDDRETLK